MAPNCGFQSEYWTSRWAVRELLKSYCEHICMPVWSQAVSSPKLHDTATLSVPLFPFSLIWAHPLYHPQKQSETLSKKRTHEHSSVQGQPATEPEAGQHQHRCTTAPGEKLFEHGDPCYPHVSREAGKLASRAYKQHSLRNYAPTGIYYLETTSGIKLPGKIRLQSK